MKKQSESQKEEKPGRPKRQDKWTRLDEFVFQKIKALARTLPQDHKATTHEQAVALRDGLQRLKAQIAMLKTRYMERQLSKRFLGLKL